MSSHRCLAAAFYVFIVLALCIFVDGVPVRTPGGDRPGFDFSAVFTNTASRLAELVSGTGETLLSLLVLTNPKLQTTTRYTGGSFLQEMSYQQKDNPGTSTGLFTYADGWPNGQPFKCGWDRNSHHFDNDALVLDLKKKQCKDPGSATGKWNSYPFTSAEFRSHNFYGSGCYSICMKPARASGVSSSFYIHSGEYYVPSGFQNPQPMHNEIDVEIIGKDTWGFQSNFFSRHYDKSANSGSGNEGWHPLDFDTAAGFHSYTFKWTPYGITWWVDGNQVRNVWGGEGVPSPNYSPMRVMGNIWPVNEQAEEWAGPLNHEMTYSNAKYKWVVHEAGSHCGPSANHCPLHG